MQTRLSSFIESWLNVFIGWTVGVVIQVVVFPIYGISVPLATNLKISIWFTLVSVIRSYIVRRYFNNITHRNNSKFESKLER